MGRGSRPKIRWANDRRRRKKAREKRNAPQPRASHGRGRAA
ncbi:MAG TPA: hypothetical protein VLB86_03560 [Gaiellaceae bacterium]|nr:hypothetical protein [Gaiellaceae bacterium]